MEPVRPEDWGGDAVATTSRTRQEPERSARLIGSKRLWAILCPNPFCDMELVIFPEHGGKTVACPSCGFEFSAPRVVPIEAVPEEVRAPGGAQGFASESAARTPPFGVFAPRFLKRPASPAATGRAADALNELARATAQAGPVASQNDHTLGGVINRRSSRRFQLIPWPDDKPSGAQAHDPHWDLALTWIVAFVVSGGLGLAAWAASVPEIAWGVVAVVGLAAVRTLLLHRLGKRNSRSK